jgi:hypothetical protein
VADEEGPKPYAPTIEEPPIVSSGNFRAFLRQALAASIIFWIVAALGAGIATVRWTEGFLHYLRFSAFIVFGLVLFGGSTLANRITTLGADKWGMGHGRYGYEEQYGDGGGLTGMGIVFVLAPQIGLIAFLVD